LNVPTLALSYLLILLTYLTGSCTCC